MAGVGSGASAGGLAVVTTVSVMIANPSYIEQPFTNDTLGLPGYCYYLTTPSFCLSWEESLPQKVQLNT